MEVGAPLGELVRRGGAGGVGEAHAGVNLVGEAEVVVPVEVHVDDGGLKGGAHVDVAAQLEAEGVHGAEEGGGEGAVVALAVGEEDEAEAAVEVGEVLVVGG